MAAFEDVSGPDLDSFVGRGWSDWQDAVESESTGESSGTETPSSRVNKEVARLKRKDFVLFGHCPAKDCFYVVICEQCGRPFKPQAFHHHIEKYHKGKVKVKSAPVGRENSSHVRGSSSVSKSSSSDRSFHSKSSASSDGLSVIASSNSTIKRPDKNLLCNAIKHALGKVGSPTRCKSPVFGGRSGSGSKNQLSSQSTSFFGVALDHGVAASKSLPVGSQLKKSKNSSKSERYSNKTSKSTVQLPLKPHHKIRPENVKNFSEKSDSERLQYPTKSNPQAPRDPHKVTKSASTSSGHTVHYTGKQSVTNGPVVLLDKSPSVEKSLSMLNHLSSSNETSTKLTNYSPNSKLTPPTSQRQYKHHHNPQQEIVKAPDRGVASANSTSVKSASLATVKPKSKKNIPLKAREYDPNKHCGVWVMSDNSPCTRSLTCKTHARSLKRKVQGRRKPFDELVLDHARAKQLLKERSAPLPSSLSSPQPVSGAVTPESSDSISWVSAPSPSVVKSSISSPTNQNKAAAKIPSKPKSSIHLFPRPVPPRYVDCWQDPPLDVAAESNAEPNQTFISTHPTPLAVCDFGARMLGRRQVSFSRCVDHLQRKVSSILQDDGVNQSCSYISKDPTCYTTQEFTAILSLSDQALERLRTKVSDTNSNAIDQEFDYSKAVESFANPIALAKRTKPPQLKHKPLTKSMSLDSGGGARTSTATLGRPQRSDRYTIDSGPPHPKLLRPSLPVENKVTNELKPKPISGKFVQLSSQSKQPTSNATTIDLSSYLTQTDKQTGSKFATAKLSQNSGQLQSWSLKGKKGKAVRKNSLTRPLPQNNLGKRNAVTSNHLLPNSVLHNKFTSHVDPGSRTVQSRLSTSSDDNKSKKFVDVGVKEESHPMNGLSSTISSWPQSVTLSGTIGALMHTNSSSNDVQNLKALQLNQLTVQGGPASHAKHAFQNLNNSNNCDGSKQAALGVPKSVEINGLNVDVSQPLLQPGHELSSRNVQMSMESMTNTGIVGVDIGEHFQAPASIKNDRDNVEIDFYPSELLSLLNPGGGSKDAGSSSSSTFSHRPEQMLFFADQSSYDF
ncbi:uncharacterized protein LOC143459215 isoform X2 [Clavelina lepadiformis]|uniref:uncharacterized protein LOC143459215 isoform X2 n=1 Tax=Clavelina lepadiformis TaxID=159417 RepID=UPI0040432355